jgi:hypothetical protein
MQCRFTRSSSIPVLLLEISGEAPDGATVESRAGSIVE